MKNYINNNIHKLVTSLVNSNTTSKRMIEHTLIIYYIINSIILLGVLNVILIHSFISTSITFFIISIIIFLLFTFFNIKVWKKASEILLSVMYGNPSNVNENGDNMTISVLDELKNVIEKFKEIES